MSDPKQSGPPLRVTENPITYHDIASGLVWPLLLRGPMMALRPSRITLGFLGAFALSLWGSASSAMLGPDETRSAASPDALLEQIVSSVLSLRIDRLFEAISDAVSNAYTWIQQSPLDAVVVLIPSALLFAIAQHAVSRSVTIEHATGRRVETIDALNTALRSIRQLALVTLGPLVPVAIVALLALGLGFTLGIPVLDILGALLYAIVLALSLLAVIVLWAHLITLPVSVAALASEGTDGFDGVQRSLAYLASRPLRFALYTSIIIASISICVTIAAALVNASEIFLESAASVSTNDAGRRLLSGESDLGATGPAASSILGFWRTLSTLLLAGYAISLIGSCGSMMYLCLRRVCDGQDTTDVWDQDI